MAKKTLTAAELKKLGKELEEGMKQDKANLQSLKKCDTKGDAAKMEKLSKKLVDD